MYLGKIVELAEAADLYRQPLHPYTQVLISAIPSRTRAEKKRRILEGDVPSPINPPAGAVFKRAATIAVPSASGSSPSSSTPAAGITWLARCGPADDSWRSRTGVPLL